MFTVLDEVCEPKRATEYSACVDLFAREDVIIGAGETKIIPLGVDIDLEQLCHSWYFYTEQNNIDGSWEHFLKSHYLALFIHYSLAPKGLIIPNGQGVIDLDYADEIGLIVHNPFSDKDIRINGDMSMEFIPDEKYGGFKISKGDKVAQCTLMEHKSYLMVYEMM